MRIKLLLVGIFLMSLLTGCSTRYFDTVSPPTEVKKSIALDQWPFSEFWQGYVFNGNKIGFNHFQLAFSEEENLYALEGSAALHFKLLGFDKSIRVKSVDKVTSNFLLREFSYRYELDGQLQEVSGSYSNGNLIYVVKTGDAVEKITKQVSGPLYPASVINLYPVHKGLKVGNKYVYKTFDAMTQKLETVKQEVVAYQTSDLFPEKAYFVKTRYQGHSSKTWFLETGQPRLELSLRGVLVAHLEPKEKAQAYLAQAALNKTDVLLDYALIKADLGVDQNNLSHLTVKLSQVDSDFEMPQGDFQQCISRGDALLCTRSKKALNQGTVVESLEQYTMASATVPIDHPIIKEIVVNLGVQNASFAEKVSAILKWTEKNIEPAVVDSFSSVQVIEKGKAECQGHSYVFASLARSLGIPTRLANGIVYAKSHGGFLYHTWVESWDGSRWVAIDPTLRQAEADPTHITFLYGESQAELLPLSQLIGQIDLEVIEVR